jgi:uncharacterized membrane protein YdjX (TVP38/TMEM64 family)
MNKKRLLLLGIALAVVIGLTALWRWTPLADWFSLEALTAWALAFKDSPSAWFWILAAFVIAGQVFFPITLLNVAAVLAFGPFVGTFYSIAGSLAAGVVTYAIGRMLGEETIRKNAGTQLEQLRRQIKKHGLATSIAVHIVPVAPFTLVNLLSGACGLRFGDFVLGTLIGQLPGAVSIVLLERQLMQAIKSPDVTNMTLLGLVIIALTLATVWLQRWIANKDALRSAGYR